MVLEEFIFSFKCLYFSEYDIRMLLFIFWLRNRLSINYVSNCRTEGEPSKMCIGAQRGRKVEKSVLRYVRIKWMAPNKFCGIFFVHWFGQVQQRKMSKKKNVIVFFRLNYDYFIYAIIRIFSPSFLFEYPQKTSIRFSSTKKFLHKLFV